MFESNIRKSGHGKTSTTRKILKASRQNGLQTIPGGKLPTNEKIEGLEERRSFQFTCCMCSVMPAIVSELTAFSTSDDRYFSTNYFFETVWPNIVMSRSVTSASSKGVHSQNFTCISSKKLSNCA